MREIILSTDEEKKQFILEHGYMDLELNEIRKCMHCGLTFEVKDFKAFEEGKRKKEYYVCCPNAPECSGTIMDWTTNLDFGF